jgi:hypothetical protein
MPLKKRIKEGSLLQRERKKEICIEQLKLMSK